MTSARRRERILPRLIEEEIRQSFLDYSMSVIVQRAIPDIRDGLKPVHRRILYAMHELGLGPDRPYKKAATVVGDVLGKYHPHGDGAVYDALVRMVQEFSLRYPLIDGQGNFGSIDGDSAAAYRYTEARLAPVATEILADIEKDTVRFELNFDGRLHEPTVLPSILPNLLVNGSSGIAVGMSTNVPPHNLREVAAAIRMLVGEDEVRVEDLMAAIPGPDFPTGGYVVGTEGIESMYRTGRGRIVMRARVVKEALRGGKEQLVVTELPYAVSKSRIIQQIADLARRGSLDDVADLRDESDRDGIRVVIELKRKAKAGKILRTLYKKTYLQTTFGAILLALDDGQPKEFNLLQILEAYRDHRLEVIRARSQYDLERAEAEKHVTEGLLAALDAIDEVIRIIRGSENREQASTRLQDQLGLSEAQANAILNMRLARLTNLEHKVLSERLSDLTRLIRELRGILKSEARQIEVMLEELERLVEQYGDERRTQILSDEPEEIPAAAESAVADEDVVITVSHQGFVKRIPMHLYRRRVKGGKALAGMERYDDDYLEKVFVARTSGWILAFTESGHTHFLPVLDAPESGRASRGQSLYALLAANRDDPIVAMLPVDDLSADRHVVFVSAQGITKRTSLADFSNPRSGGIIGAGVKKGDRILDVALSDGEAEVMLVTKAGRAIRFPENQVSVVGRAARGVKGIDLKGDDHVIGMILVRRGATVLTVTEEGTGKRTPVEDFPLQSRGGLGTLASSSDSTSPLVGALEVVEGDNVMIVSAGGQVTRVDASELPVQGRRTKGRALARVAAGDRVVELTRGQGDRRSTAQSGPEPGDSGEPLPGEASAGETPHGDVADAVGPVRVRAATGGGSGNGGGPPAGERQLDLLGE